MKTQGLIRTVFCLIACLLLGLFGFHPPGSEAKETSGAITAGMDLPQFKLDTPHAEKDKQYLGLKKSKTFSLSQIPAKLIVLEIFSVYCSHCKKQAGKLNRLYHLIHHNPELSQDIKMISIATGSDRGKSANWKKILEVPFPVIADPYTEIHKKLGQPGVPLTLVVKNNGKVMSAHTGVTEDVDELLRSLKEFLK